MLENFNLIRHRIYEIIEPSMYGDKLSKAYDIIIIIAIIVSLIPLLINGNDDTVHLIEEICIGIFIIDYILRLATADFKMKKVKYSFLKYPFTPMAIIDLLSILPICTPLSQEFYLLRIVRLIRTMKVVRYSKSAQIIIRVFVSQKKALLSVFGFTCMYIFIISVIIFNAEPETFDTIFDAIYWGTVTITTLGYGDLYPVSSVGRVIAMISALVGVAVIALPSGIITAGYMNEMNKLEKEKMDDYEEMVKEREMLRKKLNESRSEIKRLKNEKRENRKNVN